MPFDIGVLAASSKSKTSSSSGLSAHARRTASSKPDVQIRLDNHYKTKTYTSASSLSGDVTITTQCDARFDSIEIVLQGRSKTRTEGYCALNESGHTFLRLSMPVPDAVYPIPRVLEAGTTLTVPFNFVLPAFLPLNACNHKLESDHVRERHLRPPPSMGSRARADWERDDLAPYMAEVEYGIKASVWRGPNRTNLDKKERPVKLVEVVMPIQVLPASAEEAPLSIADNDSLYRTSRTRTVRKNLFSPALGRLTVAGQQPRAVVLQPDGTVPSLSHSVARLDLGFEPATAGTAQPPRITGVSAKLVAYTFYSFGPIKAAPDKGDWIRDNPGTERRGVYSTAVDIATASLEQPVWRREDQNRRRDSGYGSGNCLSSPDHDDKKTTTTTTCSRHRLSSLVRMRPTERQQRQQQPSPPIHTTTLHVPFSLPDTRKKVFLPTFHSCILSRVYALHVSVTVGCPGAANTTTVSLDLPLQVVVQTGGGDGGEKQDEEIPPSFEDAATVLGDELLSRLRVSPEEGTGDDVLPAYVS